MIHNKYTISGLTVFWWANEVSPMDKLGLDTLLTAFVSANKNNNELLKESNQTTPEIIRINNQKYLCLL